MPSATELKNEYNEKRKCNKMQEKDFMTNAFDENDVMVFDNDNGRDIN